MKKEFARSPQQFSIKQSLLISVTFALLLWCIKSAEILFSFSLTSFGVYPLQWNGLIGVIFSPLIHGSLEHLFNNTLPLLILLTALMFGYPNSRYRLLIFTWVGSGILVWLFARPAFHIGASGLTHGIFFYLFVISILRRDKRSVAIMMIAFFMYGSMVMTIFPRDPDVSYEAHFFGALCGTIGAFLWYRKDEKPEEKRYSWQEDMDSEDPVIGDLWKDQQQDSQHLNAENREHHER